MSVHHRSGKAWRLHDSKRIKQKVSKYLSLRWHQDFYDKETLIKIVAKRSKCRKNCSCYMCGNPRKFLGQKTIKEVQNLKNFKEQCLDLE